MQPEGKQKGNEDSKKHNCFSVMHACEIDVNELEDKMGCWISSLSYDGKSSYLLIVV